MVYENIIIWVSEDYHPKKERPDEYAERVTPTLNGWDRFSDRTRVKLYGLVEKAAGGMLEGRKRATVEIEKPPAVKEWHIAGLRMLINEYEWLIVYYRHKLRELGARLIEPYPSWRIRRLEEWYLSEIGWTERRKKRGGDLRQV